MTRLQAGSVRLMFLLIVMCQRCVPNPSYYPSAEAATSPGVHFRSVFGWGDSLTDTGNSLILMDTHARLQTAALPDAIQGRLPYGETFFGKPAGRFCDGRLLVDFLVEELGAASKFLEPSLALQGQQLRLIDGNATTMSTASAAGGDFEYLVNFAVAGATALSAEYLNATYNITPYTPYSLESQLGWFSNLSVSQDKEALSEALVFFGEIGGNDYNYAFGHGLPLNAILDLVPRVITQMRNALEFMVKLGVKYIVVQGDYPMGCIPLYQKMYANSTKDALGCVEEINHVINTHNLLLLQVLDNFTLYHKNVSFIFFDSQSAFMQVFQNPSQYGFIEREQPCYDLSNYFLGERMNVTQVGWCEDPSSHIIWDGPHLTEAMNKVLLHLFHTKDYAKPYPNFLTT